MDFKLEDLEKAIADFYYGKEAPAQAHFSPFITNTKWIAEDGTHCSSSNLGNGLVTGDGGAEIFMNEMRKQIKEDENS